MVSGPKQFKQLLSRLLNRGPCSIVNSGKESSNDDLLRSFIFSHGDDLSRMSILPVLVDCSKYNDSLSTWKGISDEVKAGISKIYPGNEITDDDFNIISQTTDTDDVQSYLIQILDEMKEDIGWTILLVLNHFDVAILNMPAFDIMKVRELSSILILMTITSEPLATLGNNRYGNAYFCNQFDTFYF